MSAVQRFEDLEVWKLARVLAGKIHLFSLQVDFSKDYGFKDQIQRATVSIVSNIAEGFERHTNTDLRQFLTIARGSNGEVRSQLHVAFDVGYVDNERFNQILSLSILIGKMLTAWMSYLKHAPASPPPPPSPI